MFGLETAHPPHTTATRLLLDASVWRNLGVKWFSCLSGHLHTCSSKSLNNRSSPLYAANLNMLENIYVSAWISVSQLFRWTFSRPPPSCPRGDRPLITQTVQQQRNPGVVERVSSFFKKVIVTLTILCCVFAVIFFMKSTLKNFLSVGLTISCRP